VGLHNGDVSDLEDVKNVGRWESLENPSYNVLEAKTILEASTGRVPVMWASGDLMPEASGMAPHAK
jgi:hypothetical protein